MKLSLLPLLPLLALVLSSPLPEANPTPEIVKRETALNAFLALLLDYLPNIDASINTITGVLTAFEELLAILTGDQTTYNDLGTGCKDYTIVFARGTTEPGNVGILVGPVFFDALKGVVGSANVAVQGVNDYSASVDGYLEGGDPTGSATMASEIETAVSECPNTILVVSGYSQGAQLVHNSIALLPAATAAYIDKVVVFGDPDNGTAIPNVPAAKVKTYCNADDNICVNGDLILPAHLTYGSDADGAANFVVG